MANISYMDLIRTEIEGLYGAEVLRDIADIIKMYLWYDGKQKDEKLYPKLDYTPTDKRTNLIKKLIKEEARFLFGKQPEFFAKCDDEKLSDKIEIVLKHILNENMFSEKLIKAARDCFIGKRIAIKLTLDEDDNKIKITFHNSMGFVFEPQDNDVEVLQKIIFFYAINDKQDKNEQRLWKQKYYLDNKVCYVSEAVYDGNGKLITEISKDKNTKLDFIPAKVIINDGLTGDLKGESDVEEIMTLQDVYNKLTSDDIDALKFNMFPQSIATNASQASLENMVIAPGALVDLQTDMTAEGATASLSKLESSFSYDGRLENTLSRLKSDMFDLLNVPNLSLDQMQGTITSGKAMKAIYWPLVTRCEEKFATWKPSLVWLADKALAMSQIFGILDFTLPQNLEIGVVNVYPLMEDEFEEKALDMTAVRAQTMSRKTYIQKWNADTDETQAQTELEQIMIEKRMLEDNYAGGMGGGDDAI